MNAAQYPIGCIFKIKPPNKKGFKIQCINFMQLRSDFEAKMKTSTKMNIFRGKRILSRMFSVRKTATYSFFGTGKSISKVHSISKVGS